MEGLVLVGREEGCSLCVKAKDYLDAKGIKYAFKDIDADKELRNKIVSQGIRSIPVFMVGDEIVFTSLTQLVDNI